MLGEMMVVPMVLLLVDETAVQLVLIEGN